MAFNLNETGTSTFKIFNGGNAGLVKNVTIKVEKRQPGEPETYPDYKLVVTDSQGGTTNVGFYYFKEDSRKDKATNDKFEGILVSRVVSIARAVMGDDHQLPEVATSKEALDFVFKLVNDNAGDKKFNVYATYGTKDRPSKWIGLRFFNFIESADKNPTTLFASNRDLLERITEDPKSEGSIFDDIAGTETTSNGTIDRTTESWL